ncbi:GLYK [Symbiodinium sp. CCMP2592]|nr:GLYK [Symbiodinium sp. CCMP2592]
MPKLARLAGLAAVSSLPLTFLQSRRGLSSGGFSPQTCVCEGHGSGGSLGSSAAPSARRLPALRAAQVEDFVREGPLYKKLLLCCSPPYSSEWIRHGEVLAERLGPSLPGSAEEEKIARRIYHFYLPIYYWMRQQMAEIRASRELRGDPAEAICFGLSAPQGCGKTTMVTLLEELFRSDGLSCESLSIDDFYLPASWQEAVSELHSGNPLLQTRGNAGTHDVQLGTRTLKALKKRSRRRQGTEAEAARSSVFLPRYDKSADSGRGDQVPQAMWKPAKTPCDVLLLEGWMLGFKPTSDPEAVAIHPGLRLVNQKLKDYQAWDDLVDSFCILAVEDIQQVYAWRQQAETQMKQTRGAGMSEEAVKEFVDNYMPAYAAYRQTLYASAAAAGVDGKPSLLCWVGPDRLPYDDESEA